MPLLTFNLPDTKTSVSRVLDVMPASAYRSWAFEAVICHRTGRKVEVDEYIGDFDGAELLLWKRGEDEPYACTGHGCTCPAGRAKLTDCRHRAAYRAMTAWMLEEMEADRPHAV